MASEAFGGNMHMDARVIKIADVKPGVIWRPPWPRGLLEAICTWIPGQSRLLMSNLRSYDLRCHLEAAMASEAIGGNMHMDTRVIMVADVKSEDI